MRVSNEEIAPYVKAAKRVENRGEVMLTPEELFVLDLDDAREENRRLKDALERGRRRLPDEWLDDRIADWEKLAVPSVHFDYMALVALKDVRVAALASEGS
jgi:hypothetical protein